MIHWSQRGFGNVLGRTKLELRCIIGASFYSDDHYAARSAERKLTGDPVFAYHAKTASKPVGEHKAHEKLDPKELKFRESRDSTAHPNSNAMIFAFDNTGSMKRFPRIAQEKLPALMGLLLRKGFLVDPQICVCAFGDQTCDRVPLQIGQFESGIEIEDCLINLFLEGGGGAAMQESPELVLYFAARKTKLDCFEKRGKKGFLFIITDEMGRSINSEVLSDVFGEAGQDRHLTMEQLVAEAGKMYEIFVITPGDTSNFHNVALEAYWKHLIGQHYLTLDDPNAICELVASTIGLCEKAVDRESLSRDLVEVGLSKSGVDAITTALAKDGATATTGAVLKVPVGSGLSPV